MKSWDINKRKNIKTPELVCMINDIDILEEHIKNLISLNEISRINEEMTISFNDNGEGIKRIIQAISTLIAENKELKEENKCLKNKELDYMTVYLNGVYDGEKKVKDKIKAKIEEVQIMYDGLPKNPKEHLHSKTEYKIVIGVLQELLEKE